MYSLGWFSTGRGETSRDLLNIIQDEIKRGQVRARISFVFCNRAPGQAEGSDRFLRLVREHGIPLVYFSSKDFEPGLRCRDLVEWRLRYDREVMKRLADFEPDLCVLAGYKLVVGSEICRRYDMVNLHPAPPGGPAGTWQEVIWQQIESRAETAGAMMHLVTPELDEGPPVTYCRFSIQGGPFEEHWREVEGLPLAEIKKRGEELPLFKLIRRHGVVREFPLITTTVKAFSEGRVRIDGERVVDGEGRVVNGYDLTAEIDARVAGLV